MTELSSEFIRQLVAATQGVELDNVAAVRVATVTTQVIRMLDAKFSGSQFDTEPAKFDAMLAEFAGHPKSND